MKIFVTLGSQKFQMDRLVKKVDEIAKDHSEYEFFVQTGFSNYEPANMENTHFIDKRQFDQKMKDADIVITHGGTGAIIGAIKNGKKAIGVPRKVEYKEHVDDHQQQIVETFEKAGYIRMCLEMDDLEKMIEEVIDFKPKKYVSNTKHFIKVLDKTIMEVVAQ